MVAFASNRRSHRRETTWAQTLWPLSQNVPARYPSGRAQRVSLTTRRERRRRRAATARHRRRAASGPAADGTAGCCRPASHSTRRRGECLASRRSAPASLARYGPAAGRRGSVRRRQCTQIVARRQDRELTADRADIGAVMDPDRTPVSDRPLPAGAAGHEIVETQMTELVAAVGGEDHIAERAERRPARAAIRASRRARRRVPRSIATTSCAAS